MAVVTWPLSSGEARGLVGDLIYNTWRGRSYVKAHVHNQTGLSTPQQDIQAIARLVTSHWHDIAQADRDAWAAFAAQHLIHDWTGQPKRLSAYNWYMKLSWISEAYFQQLWDTPPTVMPSYLFTNLRIQTAPSFAMLLWDAEIPPDFADWVVDAWLEGPHNAGITPSIKRAHRSTNCPEDSWSLEIPDLGPYLYTVHVRALHSHGICMPFTHFLLDCT
jgi:hypothetical protein